MAGIVDSAAAGTPLASALAAGLGAISYDQRVTFTAYVRLVLPLDGFVFWVRADLVGAPVLANMGLAIYGQPAVREIPGALHVTTDVQANEDETVDLSSVVFTSTTEIRPFHEQAQTLLWVGMFEGIRFAIDARNSYFRQANLHHYIGRTVLPVMASQFINDASQIDLDDLVVSNSLPFWLALASGAPLYPSLPRPPMPFFPSFALPDNRVPPYAAVHVDPSSTRSLQAAPLFDPALSRQQLVRETVRITTYGARNAAALDVLDYACRWMLDYGLMGLMNMPAVRDDKRVQAETGTLAMRKTIEFEVNYYQATARTVARQLILHCVPTITAA